MINKIQAVISRNNETNLTHCMSCRDTRSPHEKSCQLSSRFLSEMHSVLRIRSSLWHSPWTRCEFLKIFYKIN